MKKVFIFLFIFSVLSYSAFAIFPDVPQEHPSSDGIDYVESQGIVEGYPDGNYKPDDLINRAEFTKIIINSRYPIEVVESCLDDDPYLFSDVPNDQWYSQFICVAKANEVVNGYPDGTFKPADNINFVEAAKIIVIAFGYDTIASDTWYEPYVRIMDEQGATPLSIGELSQKITRGEMAEFIYRLELIITNLPHVSFYQDVSELSEDIRVALEAYNPGYDYSDAIVSVYEQDDTYAYGGVGESAGGGAIWYAVYDVGGWFIIGVTQDLLPCSAIMAHDFPLSMLPACYDETTETAVDREGTVTLDEIKQAFRDAYDPDTAWIDDTGTFTIDNSTGGHATGTVSSGGGGAHWYAAEVGGTWVIVAEVQDTVWCDEIEGYDFPALIVPMCYDPDTDTTIYR
ncbi:S-layer homology domain-containing protein [Patescibacteria group bacterium]